MIDKSVEGFYTKNADQGYIDQYEKDHGPRLDAMIERWNLKELKDKRILDVGGGLGFLGKRLPGNEYWVIDGAQVPDKKRLCVGHWISSDLDHDMFATRASETTSYRDFGDGTCMLSGHQLGDMTGKFDAAFCLETLEHLTNPYHCLAEIKKLVKTNGDIYISIPHANVTHNYIYPALMVDPSNFAQFLGQMALPVREYWLWDKGWNAHHFLCSNRPYSEKVMLYPKHESKFLNATPVEMVNW